jgi:hypothetical protein
MSDVAAVRFRDKIPAVSKVPLDYEAAGNSESSRFGRRVKIGCIGTALLGLLLFMVVLIRMNIFWFGRLI